MKPYGWDNGRHNGAWKATKVLPSVRMTAHARRWETVEIDVGLDDYGDPGCLCCEFIPSVDIELDDDVYYDFCDIPPIPRVTLFDAYKAKRK
jgi:hypothetical protein